MCVYKRKRKKEKGRSGDMFWRSRTKKIKIQKKSEDRYRGRCTCVEEKKIKKKCMDEKKKTKERKEK